MFSARQNVELYAVSGVKSIAMPFGNLRRKLDQSQLYDWAMRCPVFLFSSAILFGDINAFYQQVLQDPNLIGHLNGGGAVAILTRVSQWLFVALLSVQSLFRFRPIAKSEEFLPRVGALIAICIPSMFMLLARAPPSLGFNAPALLISFVANTMAAFTLCFLGRSLSVMPEARRLVQSGPYGLVRHPLYLCEMLGTLAVFLQYRSLPAAALLLLAFALQVKRAQWEEEVLARAFGDFAAYRSQTAFLIPPKLSRFAASFVASPDARCCFVLVLLSMLALLALIASAPWELIGKFNR
jgi:protein-S-isoprenylcysteine O-methyltransferase Ste14